MPAPRLGPSSAAASAGHASWRAARAGAGRGPPPRPPPRGGAPWAARVRRPPAALSHRAGHLWEQAVLPARARGADVLVNPANLAPVAFPRNVVVIHDAAALREPAWYSRAYVAWQRRVLPAVARRALRVITVSEFSRGELAELLGVDAVVVPGGVAHARFVPGTPRQDRPYVLTVAGATARKNLAALGETARRLAAQGVELLAAGPQRPQFRAEANLPVRGLGEVQDAELPGLYAGALAFVLPSLYEGFGLPCLEAMASGVPVVASNRGALPETCGDAALLVDPTDQEALAEAVEAAIGNAELRERGLRRAAQFSWQRTVSEVTEQLR